MCSHCSGDYENPGAMADDTEEAVFVNHYHHMDCPKQPGVEWTDTWSCACNDQCPACGTKDIEPYESDELCPDCAHDVECHDVNGCAVGMGTKAQCRCKRTGDHNHYDNREGKMLTREMLHEFMKTAACEEVKTMIGDKYIRCGNPAVAIVKHVRRNEGPYALCFACASHNISNRGAVLVLACGDAGLDRILEAESIRHAG